MKTTRPTSGSGEVSAGLAATHLSATEVDRMHRASLAARAVRYLLRTGNGDLLPVLGLGEGGFRACDGCGGPYLPRRAGQRYCHKACALPNKGAAT